MAPSVNRVPMTKHHYAEGGNARRMVVLHATAGVYPGDFEYLRKGGSADNPVSIHYYIAPDGAITQFVDDEDIAWHCGVSSWMVDGSRLFGCNSAAVGIELSNRNTGLDPYEPAQYASALWLVRRLVAQYHIPVSQLVRHSDIAPNRKTDPAGFPWARFVSEVYAVTPDTPILTIPSCTLLQAQRWFSQRDVGEYRKGGEDAVNATILPAYWRVATSAGVDPCLAVAQMAHETAHLTSALSQRRDPFGNNLRNPAGIGINGDTSPGPAPGFVWDSDREAWRRCVGFPSWDVAIQAHIGRLIAYALKKGNDTQEALVATALAARPLGRRGFAPTLRSLGGTWSANKGTYGESIARIMNEMRAM